MIHNSLTPDQLEVGKTYDISFSHRDGDDIAFDDFRVKIASKVDDQRWMVHHEVGGELLPDIGLMRISDSRHDRIHSIKEVTT